MIIAFFLSESWHCIHMTASVGTLYQLFVGVLMYYLRYLYVFVYIGVQHILCCVFLLCFISSCVPCCQFLSIVHFDCPIGIL